MRLVTRHPPIVGRTEELQRPHAAFRHAAIGRLKAVLLSGEPGVGKTLLAERAAGTWRRQGALVLPGACQQYGADELAYAPFVGAWAHLESHSEGGFGALLAGLAGLGELPGDVARSWLFDRVAHQLARLGADRPVVLLLEDVHWADRLSLALAQFLVRSGQPRRLLLLFTARRDGAGRLGAAEALTELIGSGKVGHLALDPLTAAAARDLVRGVLDATGREPGIHARLRADHLAEGRLVENVVARSGGNPYLAHELATAARHGLVGLPDTLRRVLRLAVEAADALHRAGDDDGAVSTLRAALATAQIRDPAVRLALLDRLLGSLFATGRVPDAFAVLEEAVALVPGLPSSRESARIIAADGSRLMILGRYADGARRSATAADLAATQGADDTLAYAWTTQGVCLAATGDLLAGRALLADARRLAGACGSLAVEARSAVNLCYVLANVAEYVACVHAGREALARLSTRSLAHTLGAPLYCNTVVALVAIGAWDAALALCAEAEDAPVPGTTARFLALSQARIAALRGRPEQADAALALARADRSPREPAFHLEHALAAVLTLRAQRRPRDALALARGALRGSPGGVDHLRLCAEALRTLGDLESAGGRVRRLDDPRAVRDELCSAVEREDGSWGTHSPEAAALRLLCAAEATRLDGPSAAPWEAAVHGLIALGLRPDAAYAQLRLAEALVATRQPWLAAPQLRAAYEFATEAAAQPLLVGIETAARRGRVPVPGPAVQPHRGGDDAFRGAAGRASAAAVCNLEVLNLTANDLQEETNDDDEIKIVLGGTKFGPWDFVDNQFRSNSLLSPDKDFVGSMVVSVREVDALTYSTIDDFTAFCFPGDHNVVLSDDKAIYTMNYRIT